MNNYEVAKYMGRWSIYCKQSRTWIFCKGKRNCDRRCSELNDYDREVAR